MAEKREIEKVKKALENPKFNYRTISGIAKETGLNSDLVQDIIDFDLDNVVRSRYRNQYGEQLYTSRKKLRNSSVFSQVSRALASRAD